MAIFTEDYITSEHSSLIRGITSIYEALKSMQYIDDAELMSPPYASFPVQKLTSIGLEPEAIALLRYLPYLTDSIEISYSSKAYSYLDDVYEAREVLWEGGNDLAPSAIRLSHCKAYPGLHGRTIIYDLRSKGIIQWANNEPGYTNTYLDLPITPPEDFFKQWLRYLRDLKEIPWRRRDRRQVLAEPPAGPSNYVDFIANGYADASEPVTLKSEQYEIDGFNTREALKKLFIDHDWPDDFREDEFKTARQRWQDEFNRLELAKNTAMIGESPEAKARASDEYTKFLEESAGPAAIVKTRDA